MPTLVARISLRRSILGCIWIRRRVRRCCAWINESDSGTGTPRIRCWRWDFGYIEGVMRDT
jgi:hypothetical protein